MDIHKHHHAGHHSNTSHVIDNSQTHHKYATQPYPPNTWNSMDHAAYAGILTTKSGF